MEDSELAAGVTTPLETKTQVTPERENEKLNRKICSQLQDVLRIGIDKLLDETEQMDYAKIDFDTILGKTDKHGHWLDIEEKKEEEDEKMDTTTADPMKTDNMYLFDGVDYRSTAQKPDVDLFYRLTQADEYGER